MREAVVTYAAAGLFFAAVNPLSWAHLVVSALQGYRDRFDRFVTFTLWLIAANAATVFVLALMPLGGGFKRLSPPLLALFIATSTALVNGAAGAIVFAAGRSVRRLMDGRLVGR